MIRHLLVAGLAGLSVWSAAADDRDLLRSGADPYVFVLLDTSGSMAWSPPCAASEVDEGACTVVCPTDDCFVPRNADDPASKFHQAKGGLWEAIQEADGVHFGFASWPQDELRVTSKHWLYRASSEGPELSDGTRWPAIGSEEVFGRTWPCVSGAGDGEVGCSGPSAARLADRWEAERVRRLPKLGFDGTETTTFYVGSAGETYEVTYHAAGRGLGGATLEVDVTVARCVGGTCWATDPTVTVPVAWERIGAFLSWDGGPERSEERRGFFPGRGGEPGAVASDAIASHTCGGGGQACPGRGPGWEPNDDESADPYRGYDLRFPTDLDPDTALRPHLDLGDVVPLDWRDRHREVVLDRLAPAGGPAPELDTAAWFRDVPEPGEDFLRLVDERRRPLVAVGARPLGAAIRSFRAWWSGCGEGGCGGRAGWREVASVRDPQWACREKHLVVVTGGDDTCSGEACTACADTSWLRVREGIRTHVVVLGADDGVGTLDCLASTGGTGSPVHVRNRRELTEALSAIFREIVAGSRSFVSGTVPPVQAGAADKVYLAALRPVPGRAVWSGRIDAYLEPLPLREDGTPDRDAVCGADGSYGCRLWDAGVSLLGQAPSASDIRDRGDLRIGLTEADRRVFWARPTGAGGTGWRLEPFLPPADPAVRAELSAGLGFDAASALPGQVAERLDAVIARTLVRKEATIEGADGSEELLEYVLGDVFHSDPQVVERPASFVRFAADLFGRGRSCAAGDPGYRCFAERHRHRRRVLLAGASDGQLHGFDAGIHRASDSRFDDGTGLELFSVIPRMTLPIVRELAEGEVHVFGIDGVLRSGDVFVDAVFTDLPEPEEREWRTIVVGGLREGGTKLGGSVVRQPEHGPPMVGGYFAIDVTQPDVLEGGLEPREQRVPSCLTLNGSLPEGCGPLPYPSLRWEYTDSSPSTLPGLAGLEVWLDEDGDGYRDLGDPWSRPVLGRIAVLGPSGTVETRFVAIFGGGLDPARKVAADPRRGNFVYMVDVETGEAIYKREVEGSVPSIAALDVDRDDVVDALYFGTTAGRLYKADLTSPLPLAPQAVDVVVPETGISVVGGATVARVTGDPWDPFVIFRTGDDQPIFHPPTLLFVARLGRPALAFGTGDREDLWDLSGVPGRFHLLVDEGFSRSSPDLPRTEVDYVEIDPESGRGPEGVDHVLSPPAGFSRGWWLALDADERLITPAVGVAGVVVFSSYRPSVVADTGGVAGGDAPSCLRSGSSRSYLVFAHNGDPVGEALRYEVSGEFVSAPFVEQAQTQNRPSGTGSAHTDELDSRQQEILDLLEGLYPEGTRFGNYWLSVRQLTGGTRVVTRASVPVGVVIENWREE